MKIYNTGKEFELKYNGQDIFVPEGLSEDMHEDIINQINTVAVRWGKEVEIIPGIEEEKAILAKYEKTEEKVEEKTEDSPKEKIPVEETK